MGRDKKKKNNRGGQSRSPSEKDLCETHQPETDSPEQVELTPPNSSSSSGKVRKKRKHNDEEDCTASVPSSGASGEISEDVRNSDKSRTRIGLMPVQMDEMAKMSHAPVQPSHFGNLLEEFFAAQKRFDEERKSLNTRLEKEHDQLVTALRKNSQLESSLSAMKEQLKSTEYKYLQSTNKLYPRGIIERYEELYTPYNYQNAPRLRRWKGIIKDHSEFMDSLRHWQKQFGNYRFRKPVPKVAADLYSRLSDEVHDAWKKGVEVYIDESYLTKEEEIFMLALCDDLLPKPKVIVLSADGKTKWQMP